ncbi:MAG TPA: prepilin-type N-terminal cleavage/methylation domain-containing protein [Methylomirabilota bacterium]|nr:prepilin-type N-terminal cleavage/methylation domain-containing protein [Methylomirabilota bacterium]
MAVQGNAGYSLIELLVAMTLFAIVAFGLASAVALVTRSGVLSDHLTRATFLAQDKLEALVSHADSLTDGTDAPEPGFSRSWFISADDPEPGVHRVEVMVSWEGRETPTVSLTTVVND